MKISIKYGIMHYPLRLYRSYLKNVFWPNVFVGASFQILKIPEYSSGLKLGPAATLNQNPIFEKTSIITFYFGMFR